MTLIQIVWNQKEVEEINPEHIVSILKDHKHNYLWSMGIGYFLIIIH